MPGVWGADAPELPDDDGRPSMYRRIVAGLERVGYHWYEVSNFALPGRRCRHNCAYWRGRDYLGLGPAAVSTVGEHALAQRRRRRRRTATALLARVAVAPPREMERLDGPRGPASGCSWPPARARRCRSQRSPRRSTGRPSQPLAAAGFVSVRGGTLRVTRKGRYVANEVCVRLFRASSF